MNKPFVSIIVPVYNAEIYLRRCIESVIQQTFQDFELLLINDGSSDRSYTICEEYSKKDSRVKVFNKKNGGVSSARNLGIDNALGKWISFVDADDKLYSEALTCMIDGLKDSETDVVLVNVDEETSKGVRKKFDNIGNYVTNHPFHLVRNRAIWGYLFSTELIKTYNLRFSTVLAYSEDTVFLYSLLNNANRLIAIDKSLYLYNRLNENSACSSLDGERKVKHQINAAQELNNMKQFIHEKYKKNILDKEIEKILFMGFVSYHRDSNNTNWRIIFSYFKEKMSRKLKYRLLFLGLYSRAFLLVQRRKIIKFNNA